MGGSSVVCYKTTHATGTSMSGGRNVVARFNILLNDPKVVEQIRKQLDDLMLTEDSSALTEAEQQLKLLQEAQNIAEPAGGVALGRSELVGQDAPLPSTETLLTPKQSEILRKLAATARDTVTCGVGSLSADVKPRRRNSEPLAIFTAPDSDMPDIPFADEKPPKARR